MTAIDDIRYVRLGASDLDASVRFATEIVGLELVHRDASRAYLRAGAGLDHHVVYVRGDVAREALAFEVRGLDEVITALDRAGHALREATRADCDERRVAAMYALTDPTGSLKAASSTAGAAPRSGIGEFRAMSSVVFGSTPAGGRPRASSSPGRTGCRRSRLPVTMLQVW